MSQAVLLDRQIRPIYDALDTGSTKSAILACNKVLKKYPNLGLVKALKALAIVRTNKIDEPMQLCDEVLATKPTDLDTLNAMMHVLRALSRYADMVAMFDEAFKKNPNNEELGAQDFFAKVRTANWKAAQLTATKMHKAFNHQERYLYWAVISLKLQAEDVSTPQSTRLILYKLAHRLLSSLMPSNAIGTAQKPLEGPNGHANSSANGYLDGGPIPPHNHPSYANADRLHLHLTILVQLAHLTKPTKDATGDKPADSSESKVYLKDALRMLYPDVAKAICKTSLGVDDLRRAVNILYEDRLEGDAPADPGASEQPKFDGEGRRREGKRSLENLLGRRIEVAKDTGAVTEVEFEKDRNWIEYLSVVDGVFSYVAPYAGYLSCLPIGATSEHPSPPVPTTIDDETREVTRLAVHRIRKMLLGIAREEGHRDRSGLLALLELFHRAAVYGIRAVAVLDDEVKQGPKSSDAAGSEIEMIDLTKSPEPKEDETEKDGPQFVQANVPLASLMVTYFKRFGDKACCFEDLRPHVEYLITSSEEGSDAAKKIWLDFVEGYDHSSCSTDPYTLQRSINVFKLLRYSMSEGDKDAIVQKESQCADTYLQHYFTALALGKDFPDTELQPADDLILLTAQALVNAWTCDVNEAHLFKAVAVLEFAMTKSQKSYLIRLHLIRIYRLLGAPEPAWSHYNLMNVKQMQNDTLSHFVLARATTFSLGAIGDITFLQGCLESSQIYISNANDTTDFIVKAFAGERYSQVPEFIAFEDCLDNSLQRDLVKVEHVRMRLAHETIISDIVDAEFVELKFIFDRLHHDNRDFDILPNYQPHSVPSFIDQTHMVKSSPGLGWLMSYLKIYIRVFQSASNLDDIAEERLLVGDRPLKPADGSNLTWKERLLLRKEEELAELTPVERSLFEYTMSLCDWLSPYHEHARPPAQVYLAEVLKQSDAHKHLKSPKAPKSQAAIPSKLDLSKLPANGTAKTKADEPPAVKQMPSDVGRFFEEILEKFRAVADDQHLPSEYLHVATVIQEAVILTCVEIMRFKSPAVIKQNKLGGLTPQLKTLRASAFAALQEVASRLSKLSEQEGTKEARQAFVAACKSLDTFAPFHHDALLDRAKAVRDARKRVIEGIAKGATKLMDRLP